MVKEKREFENGSKQGNIAIRVSTAAAGNEISRTFA